MEIGVIVEFFAFFNNFFSILQTPCHQSYQTPQNYYNNTLKHNTVADYSKFNIPNTALFLSLIYYKS